ncbi:MAG: DUF3806 domain-containing protein [Planctomycetota bacterium]
METRITPLFADDVTQLGHRWTRVSDLVAERLPDASLERSPDDLAVLRRLLEEEVVTTADLLVLQDMGAVLGFALNAVEPRLVWVMVEDELGRDPALYFRPTGALVFPLTMFSKRVERGEALEPRGIFDAVLAQLEIPSEES